MFANKDDALNKNPDDPDADLYSILDQLEDYRGADGRFRFKLCYPELTWGVDGKKCNEWYQTSNPATDQTITGFEAVDLAFTLNSYAQPWQGLGKTISDATLIDDAPSGTNWYCAIGSLSAWATTETIPGPSHPDNWRELSPVKQVELSVYSN